MEQIFKNLNIYTKLLRVKQYIKNILIFAPIFFADNLFNISALKYLLIAFVGFSLVTSFIYILNDINDRHLDEKHSLKSKRPVAAGLIKIPHAVICAIICLLAGLFIYHSVFVCGILYKLSIGYFCKA